MAEKSFKQLISTMKKLLSDKGCAWDREQTPETLLKYMYEEADEVSHAVKAGDWQGVKEELGDLLLQIVFQAELANRSGHFDIKDVVDGLNEKLVRRHPHVFAGSKAKTPEEIMAQWQRIKSEEKKDKAK